MHAPSLCLTHTHTQTLSSGGISLAGSASEMSGGFLQPVIKTADTSTSKPPLEYHLSEVSSEQPRTRHANRWALLTYTVHANKETASSCEEAVVSRNDNRKNIHMNQGTALSGSVVIYQWKSMISCFQLENNNEENSNLRQTTGSKTPRSTYGQSLVVEDGLEKWHNPLLFQLWARSSKKTQRYKLSLHLSAYNANVWFEENKIPNADTEKKWPSGKNNNKCCRVMQQAFRKTTATQVLSLKSIIHHVLFIGCCRKERS